MQDQNYLRNIGIQTSEGKYKFVIRQKKLWFGQKKDKTQEVSITKVISCIRKAGYTWRPQAELARKGGLPLLCRFEEGRETHAEHRLS